MVADRLHRFTLYNFRFDKNNLNNVLGDRDIGSLQVIRPCPFSFSIPLNEQEILTMNGQPGKIETLHDEAFDCGFPSRKIKTSYTRVDEVIVKREKPDPKWSAENEILRIFQAFVLSVCMLVLSYHSVLYGRTEFTVLENGQIVQGYVNKAVVTFSLGYSMPYSTVSFLAICMLGYSLVWKDPRWSLPSIVLYLADLVYDVSGAIVAVWLFFSHFPFTTALSYTIGAILLILAEIWIWMGVLRLYEQRTFK